MSENRMLRSRTPTEATAAAVARSIRSTTELLASGYQRWFAPLHAYVSRHIEARQVRERIVREVLSENLDLLVGRRDAPSEVSRLEATANRLIAEALTGGTRSTFPLGPLDHVPADTVAGDRRALTCRFSLGSSWVRSPASSRASW